jgi:hypothetical protein
MDRRQGMVGTPVLVGSPLSLSISIPANRHLSPLESLPYTSPPHAPPLDARLGRQLNAS